MRRTDAAAALDPDQSRAADAGLKAMIPIGRPFLDYALSGLADAGYTDVCLVIGPEHTPVREHYASHPARRITVTFAVQERPLGTADAVVAAQEFAAQGRFLVLNGDNYYPVEALRALRELDAPALAAFGRAALLADGHIPAERIARFAVVETDGAGYLRRIIEKPTEEELARLPGDIRVSMNCWLLDERLVQACRDVPLSPRGELELPLAVQRAVDAGVRVRAVPVDAVVLDLSSRADIAAVAARLAGTEPRP